ncbi:unnamed protein product [Ilex paraguariensis]|uniref:Uncharacterized protein n=1 Tax=Ilex paraguariensis TaxID=185542 RepID=A0ABC8S9B9_9AQUA
MQTVQTERPMKSPPSPLMSETELLNSRRIAKEEYSIDEFHELTETSDSLSEKMRLGTEAQRFSHLFETTLVLITYFISRKERM